LNLFGYSVGQPIRWRRGDGLVLQAVVDSFVSDVFIRARHDDGSFSLVEEKQIIKAITIKLEQHHIDAGTLEPWRCPVALAIKEGMGAGHVFVGICGVTIDKFNYTISKEGTNFIRRLYLQGKRHLKPITFEVTRDER
jgi:hypothetical protein